MRSEVFLKFEGFDSQKFAVPSIEDIDLGFRIHRAGYRIVLDRNIQAKHVKKWEIVSHLRTEVFCRALPWSRLILESQGLKNDMNVKNSDRLSAVLVGISLLLLPFIVWQPLLALVAACCIVALIVLNRRILSFYARKRGILFALMTIPWQMLYFLYSGAVFVMCWFLYKLPRVIRLKAGFEGNCL